MFDGKFFLENILSNSKIKKADRNRISWGFKHIEEPYNYNSFKFENSFTFELQMYGLFTYQDILINKRFSNKKFDCNGTNFIASNINVWQHLRKNKLKDTETISLIKSLAEEKLNLININIEPPFYFVPLTAEKNIV